ncbi:MAG: integrase catalytic domain-containing protein [Sciscionella sp.]
MGPIAGEGGVVFGRFEAETPNERWAGDALHGPRVGGRKTYLFAFLDDHSRLAVGSRFGFAEDTVRLAAALEPALASRGVPASTYVDNGSAFVDAWLLRACATLGIAAGALHPASAPRPRQDRAFLPHGAGSVPRRSRRHQRRGTGRHTTHPGRGSARTQRPVHRVGGVRLSPPGAFGDRADTLGPLERGLAADRTRPHHAHDRSADRGVLVVRAADGDQDRDRVVARGTPTRSRPRWPDARWNWCSPRSTWRSFRSATATRASGTRCRT